MNSKQWVDVADLCEQAASGIETGYEDHDADARRLVAEWITKLALRAQKRAGNSQINEHR